MTAARRLAAILAANVISSVVWSSCGASRHQECGDEPEDHITDAVGQQARVTAVAPAASTAPGAPVAPLPSAVRAGPILPVVHAGPVEPLAPVGRAAPVASNAPTEPIAREGLAAAARAAGRYGLLSPARQPQHLCGRRRFALAREIEGFDPLAALGDPDARHADAGQILLRLAEMRFELARPLGNRRTS